jgi:hypothetical protein
VSLLKRFYFLFFPKIDVVRELLCVFITITVARSICTMNKLLSLSSLALLAGSAEAQGFDTYACSYCVSTVDNVVDQGMGIQTLVDACKTTFPAATDMCKLLSPSNFDIDPKLFGGADSRKVCQSHGVCTDVSGEPWRSAPSPSSVSPLDIRVSKAYGSRGYNNIRLSVISNETVASEYFSYSEPFKYRWTQYHLNTGVATVKPGEKTTFTIAGEDYDVYIPPQGGGTRGVIIADPCISSEFIVCMYAKKFDTYNHLTSLLNAINSHDDVHFWNILGDNFYDQTGYITSSFFDALSKESKTKVMGSVPGNHVSAKEHMIDSDISYLSNIWLIYVFVGFLGEVVPRRVDSQRPVGQWIHAVPGSRRGCL